jgi:glutamate synthase domain-containing protein 2/CDGSH-type Zn-finger protein
VCNEVILTMNKPVIAGIKPVQVELVKGEEVYFCTCGRSASQPFCDGSHAGTGFSPLAYVPEEDQQVYLCACKHSANPPFCDGTHAQFHAAQVGEQGPGVVAAADEVPPARATPEEPTVEFIHELARHGLDKVGHHGPMAAMGVPKDRLPKWDDIQIMPAQFARKPLMEDVPVDAGLTIGPRASRPLSLDIPLLVSDMSFGALSAEAKIALARGAERAGTGICSGEGGMLPEEQAENGRYFYELASARFGYSEDLLDKVQAFHFKGGQGAKTGTGGHLPASKNIGKIAEVRGIPEGTAAVSPPTFADLTTTADYRAFGERVRTLSGGIPIGFKLSANHIEQDIGFALEAGADYLILDGRGGGTGAAPLMFRDHISVPTIPALARARHFLDRQGIGRDVTLLITGGLRVPTDFVKALALGADGIALANSAMQAIGCIGARICNSNNCPAGIATQKPELRQRLDIDVAADRLARFLAAAVELMQVMARACGHNALNQFSLDDLATFDRELAELAGLDYAGVRPSR